MLRDLGSSIPPASTATPVIEDNVSYCGYTSGRSYGGSSYFIEDSGGNWLVDLPRYVPSLVKAMERRGGIRYMFLTHRDDVADAEKYATHFPAERIIHTHEKQAQPNAEHVISGELPVDWLPGFRIIPTPGHTRGHMVLLYKNTYLFTGDHLAWDDELHGLEANEHYCWYSWNEQTKSMERLAKENFVWVLPGHGRSIRLDSVQMQREMENLLDAMRKRQG